MNRLFVITALCTSTVIAQPAPPPLQSLDSIAAAARTHVETQGLKLGTRQSIEAGPLDARLRLTQCPQPLATAFAPGIRTAARMTVEVRCPAAGGWRIFVPVKVSAFDRAVVTTRALERGHVLAASDVTVMDSPMPDLPAGYARDPAKLEGLRLARPVSAGTVLTPGVLEIDPVVRRGDRVTAVAQINGISVRAQAVALGAGAADQRIKLRNLSSGKEMEGVVRGKDLVEIAVH